MSIWGHLGSKGHLNLKCYNSSMLHSMTIWLVHVHQLETRYLCYGVKCQPGVIGVKFWFSLKMHYSYVTKYFHVILSFASHLRDKQGNWGQSGVDVSKPAGYAVCDGNMSSSFFCQHFKDLYLHYVLTDFDKTFFKYQFIIPFMLLGSKVT